MIQPASPAYDIVGTLSSGMSITPNADNAGHLIISAFQGASLEGAGTLINLRFNVIGSSGQSTPLVFADYTDPNNTFHPGFMFNEGVPAATTTNGNVTIASGPSINGVVTYGNPIGAPAVRHVSNVQVRSIAGAPPVSAMTDTLGVFSLSGFGAGSYTIAPTRVDDTSGAISAFDAGLIVQHVVGLDRLSGIPLVVADVSANGFVNSFDAGLIASFVNSSGFPYGQTSRWRFTPASRTYSSVIGSIAGENYTALLMGDVSGNWPNAVGRSEGKDLGSIAIELPKLTSRIRKEIVVPVTARGLIDKGVISYEFVLRFDPKVIQPVADPIDIKGTASRGFFVNVNGQEPGVLKVVMYGGMPLTEDGLLLNLKFAAVGAGGSISPLTFERIMFNEGKPRVTVIDGQIKLF